VIALRRLFGLFLAAPAPLRRRRLLLEHALVLEVEVSPLLLQPVQRGLLTMRFFGPPFQPRRRDVGSSGVPARRKIISSNSLGSSIGASMTTDSVAAIGVPG
jgi:hypothetical protein